MNAEDIFRKPYGAGEMNMFNFAYNLLTLRFKKANQQLDAKTLKTSLAYLNIGKYILYPLYRQESRQQYEPRSEKTGLRGFRPGPTQTSCTATEDG